MYVKRNECRALAKILRASANDVTCAITSCVTRYAYSDTVTALENAADTFMQLSIRPPWKTVLESSEKERYRELAKRLRVEAGMLEHKPGFTSTTVLMELAAGKLDSMTR